VTRKAVIIAPRPTAFDLLAKAIDKPAKAGAPKVRTVDQERDHRELQASRLLRAGKINAGTVRDIESIIQREGKLPSHIAAKMDAEVAALDRKQ
jgi:hypothetical protein